MAISAVEATLCAGGAGRRHGDPPGVEDELGVDQTNVPSGLTNAVAVAAGDYFALALKSDGTVKGWGYDGFGDVSGANALTNVAAIATCLGNNLALETNGTLVTWGVDGVAPPAGATNITAIATGKGFSLALSNGIVVAWGRDDYGQTNVPASATNVVAVAAGVGHGLALRSNGTVVAWGDNSGGTDECPSRVEQRDGDCRRFPAQRRAQE